MSADAQSAEKWLLFACDHRDSFRSLLRRTTGTCERGQVVAAKRLLLEGFGAAVDDEVPPGAAVLLDQEYGSTMFPTVRDLGAGLVVPIERSGQAELSLEYGDDFGDHVLSASPDGVKVLLRWDPHGDAMLNQRQGRLLRQVSDWMHAQGIALIVEFLTPPVADSADRASMMAAAIDQIVATGTRADLWKVEGLDTTGDCQVVADAIGRGGDATAIVLGRGVTLERAEAWLRAAAPIPLFTGFAIGKTLWQEPLEAHLGDGRPATETVAEIARRYRHLVDVWTDSG